MPVNPHPVPPPPPFFPATNQTTACCIWGSYVIIHVTFTLLPNVMKYFFFFKIFTGFSYLYVPPYNRAFLYLFEVRTLLIFLPLPSLCSLPSEIYSGFNINIYLGLKSGDQFLYWDCRFIVCNNKKWISTSSVRLHSRLLRGTAHKHELNDSKQADVK